FRDYARFRGFDAALVRSLARDAERATIESRADFWRRRDTRPPHKNPRIKLHRSLWRRAYALAEMPAAVMRRLIDRPDEPFRTSVLHWWKIGRGTRVAEIAPLDPQDAQTLIYKQFYYKGWHESLAALVRSNQAM